jgi:hypothetical protein
MHSPVWNNLQLIDSCFIIILSHFFCLLHKYLLQKWSSVGHFEVLNMSISKLVQMLWHKTPKTQKLQKCKIVKTGEFMQKYFRVFSFILWLSQWKMEIERLNISHFKAFGIINLQYEIRICQIIYNKVTMTAYVWFHLTCIRRYVVVRSSKGWRHSCYVSIDLGHPRHGKDEPGSPKIFLLLDMKD